MKKFLAFISLLIISLLFLSSCERSYEIINLTNQYDIFDTINLNVKSGTLTIDIDSNLNKDKFSVFSKYGLSETSNGDTFDLKSTANNNEIKIMFNCENIINNLNISGDNYTLNVKNIKCNNMVVDGKLISASNFENNQIEKLEMKFTFSYYLNLNENVIDNITINYQTTNSQFYQNNQFKKFNIEGYKSPITFTTNSFELAHINQTMGRIRGSFKKTNGYTLVNAIAKQSSTVDLKLKDNVYGNGESKIDFTSLDGDILLWLV